MKISTLLFFVSLIESATSLEGFDPWSKSNSICQYSMDACSYRLRATSEMTMFYKELFRVVANDQGILHKYDNDSLIFNPSQIITGDGYPKLVYVFNESLPGPALHVYQGQKIQVEIFNDLATASLSVHFHGIRQVGTPLSDGIGRLTQLSILPGSSYKHQFVATDEGTFWYHSHVHSQTAMGLLGAFIVHPKTAPAENIKEFVLLLEDWQHFYTGEQHQHLVESGHFYPNSVESLMSSGTIDYFEGIDGSRAAEALVTSILVNGRGRYFDPRSNESSTSPFERFLLDRSTNVYRLRLINGGSTFGLKFSIDDQLLEVIATDGIPLETPLLVHEILLGLGERYDVLINVTGSTSRWIRVDTIDKNENPRWHARAILQHPDDLSVQPQSEARNCSRESPCRLLNCPFDQYGSDFSRICLTMKDLRSEKAFLDEELLSNGTRMNIEQSLSLTMVESDGEKSGYESLNYISMKYPSMNQPILFDPRRAREQLPCLNLSSLSTQRDGDEPVGQQCYNHLITQFDDRIEFLLVNFDSDQHPMHLHGSYFHVIEQGLPILNRTTGLFQANNPNVQCDQHQVNCRCVSCTSNTQVVKDTIIVPSGGYLRIRFRANNPGLWLFHCHTEMHLDRGMALILHVAEDRIPKLIDSAALSHLVHLPLFITLLAIMTVFKPNQH